MTAEFYCIMRANRQVAEYEQELLRDPDKVHLYSYYIAVCISLQLFLLPVELPLILSVLIGAGKQSGMKLKTAG